MNKTRRFYLETRYDKSIRYADISCRNCLRPRIREAAYLLIQSRWSVPFPVVRAEPERDRKKNDDPMIPEGPFIFIDGGQKIKITRYVLAIYLLRKQIAILEKKKKRST